LILLSDSKTTAPRAGHYGAPGLARRIFYANAISFQDSAPEMCKSRKSSVLCAFPKFDKDLTLAPKIYGPSFVQIKASVRFTNMVGILLQNKLKNL